MIEIPDVLSNKNNNKKIQIEVPHPDNQNNFPVNNSHGSTIIYNDLDAETLKTTVVSSQPIM